MLCFYSNNIFKQMKLHSPLKLFIALAVGGCLISTNVLCQDNYRVIKVFGTIILKERGVSLATGTTFSDDDDLVFKTTDATASVMSGQRGRLILTSSSGLSSAKSNFLPAMYNISTRAGALVSMIDLQNHFSGKYVVIDKTLLPVSPTGFPMDNQHFFFLRYVYKGIQINKKLDFTGDSLIIDKKTLYTVDGNPIPSPDQTRIKLYYRKGNESILINEFDLIFPDTDQLKKEVQVILDGVKNKPAQAKLSEITSYINEEYGKPDEGNLKSWLKETFNLF